MNKRIIIEGDMVHHVGYRPFLLAKAVNLGIRNYEAENVEENEKQKVVVSISGDEKQINDFVAFAKKTYPKRAKVSKVLEDAIPPERVMSIDDYQKVLSAEQQDTIVQAGLLMLNKQDETIKVLGNKIDTVGAKVDNVGSKVDVVGNKVDSVGNKVDVVGQKVDSVGTKVDIVGNKVGSLKEETHEDFNRMDVKYDKVSKKMDEIDHTIERTMKELTQAIIKLAEASSKPHIHKHADLEL